MRLTFSFSTYTHTMNTCTTTHDVASNMSKHDTCKREHVQVEVHNNLRV